MGFKEWSQILCLDVYCLQSVLSVLLVSLKSKLSG